MAQCRRCGRHCFGIRAAFRPGIDAATRHPTSASSNVAEACDFVGEPLPQYPLLTHPGWCGHSLHLARNELVLPSTVSCDGQIQIVQAGEIEMEEKAEKEENGVPRAEYERLMREKEALESQLAVTAKSCCSIQ